MRGFETMRTRPLDSRADRRSARLKVLSIDPSVKPERTAGARCRRRPGKLTAKFGVGTGPVKGDRPAVGRVAVARAAGRRTDDGNASPVGLPVAALKVVSPPHWMPMSRR